MKRCLSAACYLSVILMVGNCSDDGAGSGTPKNQIRSSLQRDLAPAVASSDAEQLAADSLAFGVDVYGRLRAQSSGNFIFSQTSMSLALAMLYGGAAGSTAAQMAAALHFTLPPDRLHPAFDALDLALAADARPADGNARSFRLDVANSIWSQTGFAFMGSYLDLLAQDYGAGLFVADFENASEAARADINRWVSDQTQQMIPELLSPGSIDMNTRLVLANAVYFSGAWSQAFDPMSPDGVFHAPSGDVSVPMMSTSEANATLWAGPGWTAARLSYVGFKTSMILVVPDAGNFASFEQGLTADELAAILAPVGTGGAVTMPRFKFATPLPLNDVLKALGMAEAFDPAAADFSAMDGRRDLFVGQVIHKAIISVDENGTTAAAATAATAVTLDLPMPPTRFLVADRPFLFFIRHDPTGAILFQGRVVDPSQQ